jgi:hypothetical protein
MKDIFKILIIEFIVLLIVAIVGIFCIKIVFENSYGKKISDSFSGYEKCRQDLKQVSEQNAYDKVKISDTTNILLALQDYNFSKSDLPKALEDLKTEGYLESNIKDPELEKTYYYERNSVTNYTLCIYLSTGVWGTNISKCPTREDFISGKKVVEIPLEETQKQQIKKITVTQTPVGWLNVRKSTSLTAEIIRRIYPGEEYEVLEETDSWVKIKFSQSVKVENESFDSGWIVKGYTKEN